MSQNEKHSARADVFRSSPKTGRWPGTSQTISRFSRAARKHVADAKFATNLLDIDSLSLVGEARSGSQSDIFEAVPCDGVISLRY
jgi:hypothetical protein